MPVQFAAVHVLSHIGSMKSVPVLIDRLEEVKNGRIAQELIHSLEYMTGAAHGHNVMKWRMWWKKHKDGSLKPPAERAKNLELAEKKRKERNQKEQQGTRAIFYDSPIESNRVLFVVDASNSMQGKAKYKGSKKNQGLQNREGPPVPQLPANPSKMQVAKYELMKAIKGLRKRQHFNIVFFAGYETIWQKQGLLPATADVKRNAFQFIKDVNVQFATAIFDALELSFLLGKPGKQPYGSDIVKTGKIKKTSPDTIYLVTDGKPYYGQYDTRKNTGTVYNTFTEKVNHLNQFRLMKIYGIRIGGEGSNFMQRLVNNTLYYPDGTNRPAWWIRPGTSQNK